MAAAITAACSAFTSRSGITETATGVACRALPVRLRYGKSENEADERNDDEAEKEVDDAHSTAPYTESGIRNGTSGVISDMPRQEMRYDRLTGFDRVADLDGDVAEFPWPCAPRPPSSSSSLRSPLPCPRHRPAGLH